METAQVATPGGPENVIMGQIDRVDPGSTIPPWANITCGTYFAGHECILAFESGADAALYLRGDMPRDGLSRRIMQTRAMLAP